MCLYACMPSIEQKTNVYILLILKHILKCKTIAARLCTCINKSVVLLLLLHVYVPTTMEACMETSIVVVCVTFLLYDTDFDKDVR